MTRSKIKQYTDSLIDQFETIELPIDVEMIAALVGIEIKKNNFGTTMSGFALQKNGARYIGVNKGEVIERQRFTIAHELGHLMLHHHDHLNYDPGKSVMLLRDKHSSEGTDLKEIEANKFAAELLMPEDFIREDLAIQGGIDLINDDQKTSKFIERMAKKYQVSTQAMRIRLTALYFN
jgi:Zn-dependent peptidase ImmA (M78 family)